MSTKLSILFALLGVLLMPGKVGAQGSPQIVWKKTVNSDRINAIIFNNTGDTVISGSSDRLINFWRVSDGALLRTLNASAEYVHESAIESLSMTPDGSRLASATYQVVKLWTLPEGTVKELTGHSDWVVGVAFSPNGQLLASASFDQTVKIWRASDGALLRTLTFSRQMRCVAFSPDGTLLAIGGGSGLVYLYRTADWTQVHSLDGHLDDIYSIGFSPNGTKVATGGYDNTARVWSVSTGTLLKTFPGNGHVYGVAFSPDSLEVAYTDGEGSTIRFHKISDGVRTRFYNVETPEVQCIAINSAGLMTYGRADKTVVLASLGSTPPPPPPADNAWKLTANVLGNGRITITPGPNGPNGKYLPGTAVELRATPIGTNAFIGWSGASSSAARTITITMNSDKTVTANFSEEDRPAAIMLNASRQLVAWFVDGTRLLDTMLIRDGRPLGTQWRIAAFADIDHDGSKDYIFQDTYGRVATWFMRGTSFISSQWLRQGHAIAPPWKVVAADDMNQDGEVDIIFENMTDGRLVVWLMNGTEFVATAVLRDGQPGALGWRIMGTADINHDGNTDLIWQNLETAETHIWFLQHTTLIESRKVRNGVSLGAKWRIVAINDFNGDGDADLLWQNIQDGRMVVWLIENEDYAGTLVLQNGQSAPSRILGIK